MLVQMPRRHWAILPEAAQIDAPHVRARVIVTFHPAAVLRATDAVQGEATYRALVEDLQTAAAAV